MCIRDSHDALISIPTLIKSDRHRLIGNFVDMQEEQNSPGRLRKFERVDEHFESTTCHNIVVLMGLVCRQDRAADGLDTPPSSVFASPRPAPFINRPCVVQV